MLKPLFPGEASQTDSECAREESRTNLFVIAHLQSGAIVHEVKVRDISPKGALLQGWSLPPRNARCVLFRGRIRLSGTIVWAAGGRAGVRFDGHAVVSEWITRGKGDSHGGPAEGSYPETDARVADGQPRQRSWDEELGLKDLASALRSAQDRLAGDPYVAAAHQDSLRVLGLICDALAARA